ncbi:MATE family efflux transporter [Shimia marina]|uniref:Multidrug-efflux transporter n=1 Tax=Shimia marina TaxID=321267 RepID=A0A0P1FAT2_9RHOB|nr:MATE family efflux transporter [Shimia marina]CUH53342.1 Multidrug-efflux transporter [Shimia marina]SFD79328.1 multidrug resistance protein, MATE family [Shimia marina]
MNTPVQNFKPTPMPTADHVRALLRLGLPLIGGHVAQFAIGLTDTIMLGWYSVESLAAVVLGSTFFFVIFILGSGFAIAVMPLVAEADAEGDEQALRRVTRMGLWLSLIFGVIVQPLFFLSQPILLGLQQEPEVAELAQAYLRIAGLGLIPALLVMVLKSYLAALEHTSVVFWVTLAAVPVNVVVNYGLIFGNWGLPEMGVRGAAIASIIVQFVSLAGVILYAVRALPQHVLFARIWRPDWEVFAQVFRLGLPIGLTNLAEVGLFAASSLMMGWLGTIPLAAHGIALQLASLAFMVHLGLSNAATVRAGNALGRKDADHMARGAWVAIVMSLSIAFIAVTLFLLFPEQLLGLFIDPEETQREAILAIGVGLLYTAALFQVVDGAQVMALGLLRGVQDTRGPMVIAAVSYWIIGVPCAYVLGFVVGLGGQGVWLGLVVGLTAAAILLMARFWITDLSRLRKRFAEGKSG